MFQAEAPFAGSNVNSFFFVIYYRLKERAIVEGAIHAMQTKGTSSVQVCGL